MRLDAGVFECAGRVFTLMRVAVFGFFGCVQDVGFSIAGDFDIAAFAPGPRKNANQRARCSGDARGGGLALVHRGVADIGGAAERIAGSFFDDETVDHVDDAAGGSAAIGERGGAAQDLDALCAERIAGDGVVGAGGGCIDDADAVGENLHALCAEATDDGTAGAGAEGGGGDAGEALQRVAESAGETADDIALVEDRGGGDEFVAGARRADAGDDDHVAA